jgi:hypothetical protein
VKRRRSHGRIGLHRDLASLQAVEGSRGRQERQRAREDPDVLGLAPIHSHAHRTAAEDGEPVACAGRVDHNLHKLGEDACRRGARDHAHVEEAVGG